MKTKRFLSLCVMGATLCGPLSTAAFELSDTQGRKHTLADSRGRWVVLNFWATWCVPCIQEIPEIADFARAHPRVTVIGVAMDADNPARVKRFAAKTGHTFALVLADDKVQAQLGEPRALPTTRVYDPSGKVIYDRAGRVDRKALEGITKIDKSVVSEVGDAGSREAGSRTTRRVFPVSPITLTGHSPPTPTSPAAP